MGEPLRSVGTHVLVADILGFADKSLDPVGQLVAVCRALDLYKEADRLKATHGLDEAHLYLLADAIYLVGTGRLHAQLVRYARDLFVWALNFGLPLRGALAFGEVYDLRAGFVPTSPQTIAYPVMGRGLTKAVTLERSSLRGFRVAVDESIGAGAVAGLLAEALPSKHKYSTYRARCNYEVAWWRGEESHVLSLLRRLRDRAADAAAATEAEAATEPYIPFVLDEDATSLRCLVAHVEETIRIIEHDQK